jgi:C4-dicarboxylate-specific signal transduction histidine kinase
MKQVFTRWPAEVAPEPGDVADRRPRWMEDGPTGHPASPYGKALIAVALGVVALSVFLLPVALQGPRLAVAGLAIAAASVVLATALWRSSVCARRLKRELVDLRAWNSALFEKASVGLWREDWTAARDEVERLVRDGVTDVQAYYAERPDELRALRRRVVIKDVNPFALERMGGKRKEDLVGPLDRILPDTENTFVQWLVAFARGDAVYRSETHLTRPDGGSSDTLFTASIPQDREGFSDIVVADFDITSYKVAQARLAAMERDLIRASRVTTMGALTATIAHEVNSPLAAIISHAEASLRWLGRPEPDLNEARSALEHVVSDATRARDVVVRTRRYLSNGSEGSTTHDLGRLALDAVELVERELRELQVSLHFDADEALPLIRGDPVQLQQVLVNLLLNGAQAMQGRPSPRDLFVTVRGEGEFVRVDVRDTGAGLPPGSAARIFEPFYSTRQGGIGMGLAICRTVVEAHGGKIWTTEAPNGASFHFTVPTATGAAAIPSDEPRPHT